MSNNTLADNWSLQDIASLFNHGMENASAPALNIDLEKDCFKYGEIQASIVQIEALFEFLNDIVLRDQIIVDEDFLSAWRGKNSLLDGLLNTNIIRPFPFRKDYSKILEVRPHFEGKLCVTTDLKLAHRENVEGWEESRQSPHGYLSQIIWGGAGMVARGFVYEQSYTPHPLRKKFFSDTGLYQQKNNALSRMDTFVEEKRAALKCARYGNSEINTLAIAIQPVVTRIIRESNSALDLIPVAISFRDEYVELRDWIRAYQESIREPNQQDITRREKLLSSISLYIDSKKGIANSDPVTLTAGFSALKVAMKGNPINYLQNQFGVRSYINELILTESWEADLRKFLGFFNERSSKLGLGIIEFYAKQDL